MRAELESLVEEIKQSMELLRRRLDWDAAKRELDELNARSEDPTLWDNPEEAQALMQKRTSLENQMNAVGNFESELEDLTALAEMATEEGDEESLDETQELMTALRDKAQNAEIEALLSGEADGNDCFVEIHPGAGGTESNDWASMLLRMYVRWAGQRGYKVDVIEQQPGDEAGIKSATIQIKGHNAYGWMKTESGVHRLVRISPYDSNARRHTSFASVWVYPVIDDKIDIEINESECRIDTFRASGAGGQHVNTTDSAVRITHIPTNIVVQCQNERSQHKNRATAWNMLRARLYELELQKREEAASAEAASKTDIGWGHQIRSYVLQPYQLVKDTRTQVEHQDPDAVLNGSVDGFMSAALAQRVGGDAA
ncbi:peptide chain release factor 2 [Hyphococcus formosus]|uniref:peptide chain release factor 2 n=1 Tax=Hyphococcus formosus TaxID=3143534 RepID=UPI00398B3B13